MPSLSPPSTTKDLLAAALPFLRGELERVDPSLPSLIATLRAAGAGECWHKHGTFLAHLTDVYRILKLWSAPDTVALCGLYHSAYSNSYVNLAIFDPTTSRDHVRSLIGAPAERLVHLFCVVNRQHLIHDNLLFHFTETELTRYLSSSSQSRREKIQSLLPPEGVTMKHIRTGEDVKLSRRVVAAFLMITMADFSDQLFGFQDVLFENHTGRLEFSGNNTEKALWPGDGKPGLWLNSISRMGALYRLIVTEEELYVEERRKNGGIEKDNERDEDLEMAIPPVFGGCSRVLDAKMQAEARDLYWEALCGVEELGLERVEELLSRCAEKNAYVGEPRLVLAQVYLATGRWEEAEREAEEGMGLMLGWGSVWDKRVSWEGWVAWGRVMLMKARERDWPNTGFGILNLGLVK